MAQWGQSGPLEPRKTWGEGKGGKEAVEASVRITGSGFLSNNSTLDGFRQEYNRVQSI